jgi:hypothetical protein
MQLNPKPSPREQGRGLEPALFPCVPSKPLPGPEGPEPAGHGSSPRAGRPLALPMLACTGPDKGACQPTALPLQDRLSKLVQPAQSFRHPARSDSSRPRGVDNLGGVRDVQGP